MSTVFRPVIGQVVQKQPFSVSHGDGLYSPRRGHPLYFGGTPTEKPAPKQRTRVLDHLKKVLVIAPWANLLGGISLVISALIPTGAAPPAQPATPTSAASRETEITTSLKIDNPAQRPTHDLAALKKIFRQMGWTLSTVGLVTGCMNGVALGYVSKQPSMVLSSVCNVITTPFLLVDPSISIRTAMWFFTGPWLSGFANKVQNERSLNPDHVNREMDMAPLINMKALRKTLKPEEKATPLALSKAWLRESGKMLRFVGEDQVILVKSIYQSAAQVVQNRKSIHTQTRQSMQELSDYLKGTQKEVPAFIQPSALKNQIGAMLLYIGTVPILVLGGSSSEVNSVCTKLISTGILAANTSLFATGLIGKDKNLIVGIPLSVVGNAYMQTDGGMGVAQIGTAAIQNYFRKEVVKKSEPSK